MKSVWMKFCSALRAFRVARAGNVAITFAFASLPIIVGVGFAVDYSRASQVKVALQAALDSTALMISKEAARDTSSQLQTNAQNYFNALFNTRLATSSTITASYTTQGGTQVVINGTANVNTIFLNFNFLGYIGIPNMTVSSSSTVKWGSTRLRVALVLDNTGSMADSGKITALKTATANLLTQLKNAATTNGDVYVSIIPFVKDVNLGPSEWNSDWIYWGTAAQDTTLSDNNSWDANNGSCSVGNYSTRSSCVSHSTCSLSDYNSQNSCTNAGTCSLSGYNEPEQLHRRGHLLDFGPLDPEQLHDGHLLAFGLFVPEQLHGRGHLLKWSRVDAEQLHRHQSLLECLLHVEKQLHFAWRNLGLWHVEGRRLDPARNVDCRRVDAGRVERGHLDARQPQYLERLRHGSGQFDHAGHCQQLRHQRCAARRDKECVPVPGRAIRLLPASRDGPEL